jgi:hypothetical protein
MHYFPQERFLRHWLGISFISVYFALSFGSFSAFAGAIDGDEAPNHEDFIEIGAEDRPIASVGSLSGALVANLGAFIPKRLRSLSPSWSECQAKFRVYFDETGSDYDQVYFTPDGGKKWRLVLREKITHIFLPQNESTLGVLNTARWPARVIVASDAQYFSRQANALDASDAPQLWLMTNSDSAPTVVILREEQVDQWEWSLMSERERARWMRRLTRDQRADAQMKSALDYPVGYAPRRVLSHAFPARYEDLVAGFGVAFFLEPTRTPLGGPDVAGITYWTGSATTGSGRGFGGAGAAQPRPGRTFLQYGPWTIPLADGFFPNLRAHLSGASVYVESLQRWVDLRDAAKESLQAPVSAEKAMRLQRQPLPSYHLQGAEAHRPQLPAPAWPDPIEIMEWPGPGYIAIYRTGVVALVEDSPGGYAMGKILFAPEPGLVASRLGPGAPSLPESLRRLDYPVLAGGPSAIPRATVRGESLEVRFGQKVYVVPLSPPKCGQFFAVASGPAR